VDAGAALRAREGQTGSDAVTAGISALGFSILLALVIHWIHSTFSGSPGRAVTIVGAGFGLLAVLPAVLYCFLRRRASQPGRVSILLLISVAVLLCAVYFYWVSHYIFFPADILIWSEGDYVNDILKFRIGYPLYSAQINNDSFFYTPGVQLLTYGLASIARKGASIEAYRVVHVGYTVLAAVLAALCARKLLEIRSPGRPLANARLWFALWVPLLFLIATNSITSRFTQALHDDALSELVTVGAFYLLLCYVQRRRMSTLLAMAVLPAAAFLVKQSLVVWAGLYAAHLLLFDRPRSLKRIAAYAALTTAGVAGVAFACYAAWGGDFLYWTVLVLGKHGVDPLRAVQHLLDVWPYMAIGILGGAVLVRSDSKSLLGPWLIWLALMLIECYTSSIAWMINHIGPAALICGIWFCAALTIAWPGMLENLRPGFETWSRAAAVTALIVLLFSGLGLVRIPAPPFSQDAYRYLRDIEKQFKGQPADKVLLDAGSWVYLPQKVVMKDRVPSIGERGYSHTGDFSGILDRIRRKQYRKILLHGFHQPEFEYDASSWQESTGIRRALLENYRETGTIAAAARPASERDHAEDYYFFSDISILEPNELPRSAAQPPKSKTGS
jgi:hypothetical protein